VTQFATTATCDFVLKKAKVEQGPLLCSVLSPAVQAAGSYVYHNTVQKTSDVAPSFSHSSSLNPLEEAGAGTFGAYAGYQVLKSVGDALYNSLSEKDNFSGAMRVLDTQTNSLVRAGMAVIGTMGATSLANIVKQAYLSEASSSNEERASTVRTEA